MQGIFDITSHGILALNLLDLRLHQLKTDKSKRKVNKHLK